MPETPTRYVGTTMGIRSKVDQITMKNVEYTLAGPGHCGQ